MRLSRRALIASFIAGTLLATSPAHAFLTIDEATLEMQLVQDGNLIKQLEQQIQMVKQGMAMLQKFKVNTSADVFTAGGALQSILRDTDSIIARHGQITGYIDDVYPADLDRNTPAGQLAELARRQHADGRQRQIDAAKIQAELFAAMEAARVRDRNLMDESAGAPGVTSAVQATNQLVGGLNTEVRALQLATVAHQRTVEDRYLSEDAAAEIARVQNCQSLARMPESRQPDYCQ